MDAGFGKVHAYRRSVYCTVQPRMFNGRRLGGHSPRVWPIVPYGLAVDTCNSFLEAVSVLQLKERIQQVPEKVSDEVPEKFPTKDLAVIDEVRDKGLAVAER